MDTLNRKSMLEFWDLSIAYTSYIVLKKGKRMCQCACHNEFDYHKVVLMHKVESKSAGIIS